MRLITGYLRYPLPTRFTYRPVLLQCRVAPQPGSSRNTEADWDLRGVGQLCVFGNLSARQMGTVTFRGKLLPFSIRTNASK